MQSPRYLLAYDDAGGRWITHTGDPGWVAFLADADDPEAALAGLSIRLRDGRQLVPTTLWADNPLTTEEWMEQATAVGAWLAEMFDR